MAALRRYVPTAQPGDWELVTAGQRVQLLRGGTIVGFGTELVTSAGGTLAALLGASPGASSAAATMLEVLTTCFPDRVPSWEPTLRDLAVPLTEARRVLGLESSPC